MTLLGMAFLETMRIFPPAGVISSKCTKEYMLPGTNVVIELGVNIFLPVQTLHSDEKYFPNSYKFRPQKFTPQAVSQRKTEKECVLVCKFQIFFTIIILLLAIHFSFAFALIRRTLT